ncbi:family 20 glycosylhydrolase [Flammeovirga aprica]|uniref:beta-N-acetylhexosaminidase n=1 Tax=Flammeovirga aprica JL-4 TaxID=694437 RepID=A0A7X9RZS8_9BACT|nr:family 20 glycosylhydrolase [Flammeovirga aprica]NME71763.1 family 20 glycosylhydrolase [Flammeovirga aprica JL-4]
MRTFNYLLFIVFLGLSSCVSTKEKSTKDITIHWKQRTNEANDKHESFAELTIKNVGKQKLDKGNWELYFNNKPCTKLNADLAGKDVDIQNINGDFFKITPKQSFKGLATGDSIIVPLYTNSAVIKYTDRAQGFYFVFNNGNKKEFYTPSYSYSDLEPGMAKISDTDTYEVETKEIRYEKNSKLSQIELTTAHKIIPSPFKVTEGKSSIDITALKQIEASAKLTRQAKLLQSYFKDATGVELEVVAKATQNAIELKEKKVNASEQAYTLNINENNIEISGQEKGLVYGIQTLRGLLPIKGESNKIKTAKIQDQPRFEYRGLMLDVARNFQTKETILNLLDVMSFYKMNTLHFHLTDDEGWRIELKKFPELTEIGSIRKHPTSEYSNYPAYGSGAEGIENVSNGYYSVEDYVEILRFADERNITIIPEVDLPGHARIAINAMKFRADNLRKVEKNAEADKYILHDPNDESEYSSVQGFNDNTICPCQESSYTFIDDLIGEFRSIYEQAGIPLETMHLGGDEVAHGVWEKSPLCQEFMKENGIDNINELKGFYAVKLAEIAKSNQIKLQLWDDILHHAEGMSPENLTLNAWDNSWGTGTEDFGYKRANEGYDVILTSVSSLYFDMAYTKEVNEPGFYWGDYNDTRNIFNYLPTNFFEVSHKLRLGGELTVAEMKDKERLTAKGLSHIKGIQGALWAETLKSPQDAEYLLYPKLMALGERAWAKSPVRKGDKEKAIFKNLDQQWNVFANAVGQREFNRLASWGRHFRIPPVGTELKDGVLKVNVAFPGLEIRYASVKDTLDNNSKEFTSPMKIDGAIQIAAFDEFGNHGRVQVISLDKEII